MRITRLFPACLAALLLLATGCGGGGDGAPASVALSVSPGLLTVVQGSSGSVTVSVTSANFTGSVSVSAEGVPAGVSVTASPSQIAGGTGSATVNVAASSAAAPGTYSITVRGSAVGVGGASATFALTITAPPDFAVAVMPATVSLSSAAPATATVDITRRGGFTGGVALSMQSAQVGLTGVFTPASVTGASASLELSATTEVPLGTHTVTITGAGTGIGSRTTTLSVTVNAPPDFSVSVAPAALAINAGASGSTTVTIGRTGGSAGAVALSLQATHAGITGAFSPASTTGTTSALVVTVAAAVPPGSYSATITGSASGAADRTTTLSITVGAAPAVALSAVPAAYTLDHGASTSSTLTLERTNFSGSLGLSATGNPAGMTVALSPSATTRDSVSATVSIVGSVAPGVYPITVTGSGAGITNAITTITVTVPVANTDIRYCTANEDTPLWLAFQNGPGAWTRALPITIGAFTVFRFNISAAIGGVAAVTPFDNDMRYSTDVTYGTREELREFGATSSCFPAPTGRNLTASFVGGGPGPRLVEAGMGNSVDTYFDVSTGTFTLQDVPTGPQSIFAGRSFESSTSLQGWDRYVVFRDQAQLTGTPLPLIDFNGASSVASQTGTVTLMNTMGDALTNFSTYHFLPDGGRICHCLDVASTTAVRPYYTVPVSLRRPGELDEMSSRATAGSSTRTVDVVQTSAAQDFMIAFGAKLPVPTLGVASMMPYPRARVQNVIPVEYDKTVAVSVRDGTGNVISYRALPGYRMAVGWETSIDITTPDFTTAAGFPLGSVIQRGSVTVGMNVRSWTGGGSAPLLSAGRIARSASNSAVIIF